MFLARERELNSLNELYNRTGFRMTILYGRRRIGKSTLIAEFIKDKRAVFYTATKVGKERNLELFSEQVVSVLDPDFAQASFPTIEAVFDFITRKMGNESLILVIDELPYWAEKDEALLTVLQKYIDTQWADKNLMVILCGSALSFMEKKVLSEKSPLFGRRTSQIKLEAFDYKDSALFVPNYSSEEKAVCYGITGGVARYLALLDSTQSLDDNIKRLFFRTDGYLYDETRNFLTQEFSDVTLINNVIEQVASGVNTVNGISQKVGESASTVLYSLERLMEIDLVEKRKCITEEKNRKKTQYILKDHMFRFWYQFIPKAASVIELGHGDLYYEQVVKPNLHAFMGGVFEDMCRRYTLEQGIMGAYGSFLTNVGSWWGMETMSDSEQKRLQQPVDIDVVAISEPDKTAVIGECKFKNEKIDKNIYETLIRRSSLISGKYRVTKHLFFSLGGYTDWFETLNDSNAVLLTLEDLYR
ncbi:MAG: ATP-binding protein [Lachnospiraceae bacterium]|nr:ATP-binding protein [Lachnospiraceae bacterium]